MSRPLKLKATGSQINSLWDTVHKTRKNIAKVDKQALQNLLEDHQDALTKLGRENYIE